jgi:hypothetical protein
MDPGQIPAELRLHRKVKFAQKVQKPRSFMKRACEVKRTRRHGSQDAAGVIPPISCVYLDVVLASLSLSFPSIKMR